MEELMKENAALDEELNALRNDSVSIYIEYIIPKYRYLLLFFCFVTSLHFHFPILTIQTFFSSKVFWFSYKIRMDSLKQPAL